MIQPKEPNLTASLTGYLLQWHENVVITQWIVAFGVYGGAECLIIYGIALFLLNRLKNEAHAEVPNTAGLKWPLNELLSIHPMLKWPKNMEKNMFTAWYKKQFWSLQLS